MNVALYVPAGSTSVSAPAAGSGFGSSWLFPVGADEVAGAERIWQDLCKLGFAVEIGLFSAAEVGASHERQRVFILGVAVADGR